MNPKSAFAIETQTTHCRVKIGVKRRKESHADVLMEHEYQECFKYPAEYRTGG
jgi:hypothetical protein